MYSDLKISDFFRRIKLLIRSHIEIPWMYSSRNTYERVNCHGIKFYIPQDLLVYHEIYIQKQYGEKFRGNILDIGANTGLFAFYALENGASKIYTYEPYEPVYQVMLNRIRDLNETRIIPHNCLVYSETGYFPYNGIHTSGYVSDDSPHNVQSISILDIVNNNIDLVKMDVEGSEYPIIKSLYEGDKLKLVNTYYVEIHDTGMTEGKTSEIFEMFEECGFSNTFDLKICEQPYVHMLHFTK